MSHEANYWSERFGRRGVLRGAALGVAGLTGAALVGCGTDDEETPGTPADDGNGNGNGNGAAPPGQTRLTPGLYSDFLPATDAEANPQQNARYGGTLLDRYLDPPRMDINRTLSCTIYMTLAMTNNKLMRAKLGADAPPVDIELEPDLAASYEQVEDSTRFVYHLREGVMTHDKAPVNGREFTSEDVVASLDMYRAGGSQQDVYAEVSSVEAPDDYTVVVNLDQPLADFAFSQAAWSWMYVKELAEDEETRQEIAVGTGPFTQEEWTRQERSVFLRNPNYFEEGLPYLDRVILSVQNDVNAQQAGFQTHNFFHYNARDDADMDATFQGGQETMVGIRMPVARGANVNGFQFQMRNPVLQDDRVRQAISLAMDRDDFDLARTGGDNMGEGGAYSNGPIPWFYVFDEYPSREDNGPWYQFDPAEASQMMQAAGYSASNPLTLELASFYQRQDMAELAVPMVNGSLPEVNLSFRELDNPTHVTVMSDRSFEEMVGFLWGPPGYSFDQWVYPFYHSAGGVNYGSIEDSDLDGMLARSRQVTDPGEVQEVRRQIYDRVHDKVYQMWWPEPWTRRMWHNYVMNYRGHQVVGPYVCYGNSQTRSMWLDENHRMAGQ